MNNLIKTQLKLCRRANIPAFNDNDTTIIIPKGELVVPTNLVCGGYYIIELEKYIVNPPPNFTLHSNWNNGVAPKEQIVQCVVDKIVGKMAHIQGIGFDRVNSSYIDGTEWSGWIPMKSATIIKRLY